MQHYRIGRAPTNDIVVPEQTISREHAELTDLGEGRFSIKDLGSTYGTAVLQGAEWTAVTEIELERETRLRLGEFETSVAELLRVAEQTVVPGKPAATPLRTAAPPPRPAAPAAPAPPPRAAAPSEVPPKPQPPRPAPRTAAPTEVPAAAPQPPRPARTAAPTEVPAGLQTPRPAPQPPRPAPKPSPAPAAPRQPVGAFLRDMPKEKRVLVMLAGGFGVFLLISLITLVLALALG